MTGPVLIVDTHCHLDTEAFDSDRESVFERAHAAGVTGFINPAYDLESSRRAAALARSRPDTWAAVGIHPNDAGSCDEACLAEIERLAGGPRVVAIGEIGLDYHWDTAPRPVQREVFIRQLELANKLALPVIIHCRDAYDDCCEVLTEHPPAAGLVLHSFAGRPIHARFAFERGWYLGVGGPLTYKKSNELRRIVQDMPLERLLLETDAPYLPPEPLRGRRNEPAHTRIVAEAIAALRTTSIEQIAHMMLSNTHCLFRLV